MKVTKDELEALKTRIQKDLEKTSKNAVVTDVQAVKLLGCYIAQYLVRQ